MRKFLLILCIAFVVVCYGFPCIILPLGEYKYSNEELKVETTYKFGFNGKVTIGANDEKSEAYYRLKGNEIIISEDKKFDKDEDLTLNIESFYEISVLGVMEAKNQIAFWSTIGVGVLALLLVVTIPSKKA